MEMHRQTGVPEEKGLNVYETHGWCREKQNNFLNEVTEVSHVLAEHRYTPAADLFVS